MRAKPCRVIPFAVLLRGAERASLLPLSSLVGAIPSLASAGKAAQLAEDNLDGHQPPAIGESGRSSSSEAEI